MAASIGLFLGADAAAAGGAAAGGAAAGSGIGLGTALASGVAAAGVGAGLSAILAPHPPRIAIPPPPGATMISPAGSQAAANVRRRQAISGGLDSTITGAGNQPQSTSGGKTLLGE